MSARNVGESQEPVGLLFAGFLRCGWRGRIVLALACAAVLAAATPLVLVAVLVWRVLRGFHDRLRAWQVLGAGIVATVLLWPSQALYWRAWVWVLGFTGADPAAIVGGSVVAAAAGVAVGAWWFLVDQRYREGLPVGGDVAQETRIRAEGNRRRRSAARRTAWAYGSRVALVPVLGRAIVAAAPALANRHGLVVGPFLRGDLDRFRRRGSLVLPLGTSEIRHMVVLGTTGTGKSEYVWRLVEHDVRYRVLEQGGQLVYLNAKQVAPSQSSAIRLSRITGGAVPVRALIRDHSGYDMLRGSIPDQRGKLLRIEMFGDDYWRHVSTLAATLVLELRAMKGAPVSSLPELLWSMNGPDLAQMARDSSIGQELLAALNTDKRAASGAVTRYASVAMTLTGYLAGPEEGGWAWEDTRVAVCDLPSGVDRQAAASLMRVMLLDLAQYIASPRRPRAEDGSYLPLTLVLEELSALDDDPIIMRQVVDLMERGRSLGVRVIVVAQDDLGLGEDRERAAILGAGTATVFRIPVRAEDVASLAGTYRHMESSAAYSGWYLRGSSVGSTRDQHSYRVHPDELRQLGLGECWVIHHGQAAKVYALQPPSFFDDSPAAEDLVAALYAAEQPTTRGLGQRQTAAAGTKVDTVPLERGSSASTGLVPVDEPQRATERVTRRAPWEQ